MSTNAAEKSTERKSSEGNDRNQENVDDDKEDDFGIKKLFISNHNPPCSFICLRSKSVRCDM